MSLVRLLFSRCTYIFLLLTAANGVGVRAQTPQQFEGRMIASIQFEPQEQPLEASELNDILPLKMHTALRMADVEAAIERLYATGRYADIQVDAQPVGDQVVIRIITKNTWFIGRVEADGLISGPPNVGQLVNVTRLDLGQPYTDDKLTQATKDVKALLEANGLFHGRVQPQFDYDSESQQVNLTFVIDSGARARFTTPDFKGDLKMPTERLITATRWRRSPWLRWMIGTWKPVSQTKVRNGVDGVASLYQKENRLESKVSLDSKQYDAERNTLRTEFDISAGPKVEVKTTGAAISQKKLKEFIPIFGERTVDQDLLAEGARNLTDYLQSQGFFEAAVTFTEHPPANDRAEINYQVDLRGRHKLVHIEISGNHYFRTETLRERMFLQKASLLQYRYGRYSANLLRRDEDTIRNLYQSNGFRDVSVTGRTQDDYRGKIGEIAVYLEIKEGPQYFVASLDVQGISQLNKAAILATLTSTAGEPFSEFSVAVDRDAILAYYFTNGFPNATFEWSATPAGAPTQMNLKYAIKEGQQQFVREVLIDGLNATRPSLVNKNILLNPGDPLSPIKMTDTQRQLYDMGIFSKVDTAIQDPDGETERKYVLYQMYEAHRYSFAGGLGAQFGRIGGCRAGCLEAPGGTAGFAPRVSLDLTRINMFGLGHSLSFRSRVSTLDRRLLANYLFPRFRGKPNLNVAVTALWDDTRDVRTFSAKRLEGSVQLAQKVSKATTFFYRYSYHRVSVGSLNISPLLAPQLAAPVRVGMLSWNMIQDRRDDPVETHRGIYNTLDLGVAQRGLGSQVNFSRFLGRNATYHPVSRKLVLARETSFGELQPFRHTGTVLDAIPLAERFFAGGGTSHRGFPENQAGPRDPTTGFPLGGTALLFNQTELRFPLIGDNISGVLFHDAGNVYSSAGKISLRVHQRDTNDFDYMVHAAGFGLRYRTPVGPVRLDLAYSINPPRFFGFNGSTSDLFNAGPTPCAAGSPFASRCVVHSLSHFQFAFSIGQTF